MRPKTGVYGPRKKITYPEERWRLLEQFRDRAREVTGWLEKLGIESIVHGSVARGDVKPESDVDIFILNPLPSFLIETAIQDEIIEKKIIQATPGHLVKGVYILPENTTITFPLINPKRREVEFYYFGGALSSKELNRRVMGVDKRLMLIIPNEEGHEEIPLNELSFSYVAEMLGISVDVIEERVRVLRRRGEIGRTGVFVEVTISPSNNIEERLKEIAKRNPLLKAEIKRRGGRV